MREIDVACLRNANPSTNNPSSSSHFAPRVFNSKNNYNLNGFSSIDKKNKKKHETCKQSTLDSFIGKMGPRIIEPKNIQQQDRDDVGVVEGDERVSCIEIDAEAAKTWIYPGHIYYFFFETKKKKKLLLFFEVARFWPSE